MRGELKVAKDKENERSSDLPALYKERTECRCAGLLDTEGSLVMAVQTGGPGQLLTLMPMLPRHPAAHAWPPASTHFGACPDDKMNQQRCVGKDFC